MEDVTETTDRKNYLEFEIYKLKEKADYLTGHADSQQLHTPWKNDGWKIALVLGWSLLRGELLNLGGVFDTILGGGFKYFLFSPLLGEMIQFH